MRFRRAIAATSVTALALVGAAGIALAADQSTPAVFITQAKVTPATSTNWAGYVITRSGVTDASNAWFVPSVSTRSAGESAAFVGIDAANSGRVLEVGTNQDSAGGKATYSAFYELSEGNNAPETPITTLTISPGDQVFGSLTESTTNAADWVIGLDDLTTGASFTTTQPYSGFEASADYIIDAPTVNGTIAPLADFGTIVFDGAAIDGGNSNLAASEAINKVSPSSHRHVDATTGSVDADINGFQVTWHAAR